MGHTQEHLIPSIYPHALPARVQLDSHLTSSVFRMMDSLPGRRNAKIMVHMSHSSLVSKGPSHSTQAFARVKTVTGAQWRQVSGQEEVGSAKLGTT